MWTMLKYYRIFRTVLYIKSISAGSRFFSHVLLLKKLYELNFFKLQNVFQTCPAVQALFIFEALCFELFSGP